MKILDVLETKFKRGKDQKEENGEQLEKNESAAAVITAPSEVEATVTTENSIFQMYIVLQLLVYSLKLCPKKIKRAFQNRKLLETFT